MSGSQATDWHFQGCNGLQQLGLRPCAVSKTTLSQLQSLGILTIGRYVWLLAWVGEMASILAFWPFVAHNSIVLLQSAFSLAVEDSPAAVQHISRRDFDDGRETSTYSISFLPFSQLGRLVRLSSSFTIAQHAFDCPEC